MVASSPLPERVLFVSYSAALGGAERILLDLASGIDADVRLAAPRGPLADAAEALGLVVAALGARSLEFRAGLRERAAAVARIAALAREVRGTVDAIRPGIVIAWSMRALLACVPALTGLPGRPRLVFQHNDLLPGAAIGGAVRSAAARADLTVCLSEAIARDLDPRGRIARLEVVHAGVDLRSFAPAARPPAGPVLVLGAIEPWKRPGLALAVAARAPELRIRIAGAPVGAAGRELLGELRRRAAQPSLAGRVELTGGLADVLPALHEAPALLHCADREPYGLALVEALACGVPVVAPAAAGPLEIVGEGGRLYPAGDAAAATIALRDVLARRDDLRPAARRRAERLFDREDARARYRELLLAA
jgi:glycosyltransferase involved in cell wall biosynthesis